MSVPGQIRHQRRQRRVVVLVEQLANPGRAAEVALEPRPPGRAALIGQRGVDRIGAVVDPGPQGVAAAPAERRLQALAVLEGDDPPFHRPEHGVQTVEEAVGDDGVEALAVVVDDPPDVRDLVLPGLEQRLEDVALVELRVPRHRNHAARRLAVARDLLLPQILLGERGEAGHGDAHADRPGRDVHVVAVLRAGGVRLRPAERAKALQLLAALAAEEVLDGMEHRAAVRLHGHPVLRAQDIEVERRHQRDHRGARGLMTAHLQAVALRPDVVRVVDHPDAEPQHPPLERRQAPSLQVLPGAGCGRRQRTGRDSHGRLRCCVARSRQPILVDVMPPDVASSLAESAARAISLRTRSARPCTRKARTARLGGSGAGRRGPRKRTPGVRGAAPSDRSPAPSK